MAQLLFLYEDWLEHRDGNADAFGMLKQVIELRFILTCLLLGMGIATTGTDESHQPYHNPSKQHLRQANARTMCFLHGGLTAFLKYPELAWAFNASS